MCRSTMQQLGILQKEWKIPLNSTSAKHLLENMANCNRLCGQTHRQWTESVNHRANINVGDPIYETVEIMDCLDTLANGQMRVYVMCTNPAIRDHVRIFNSQFIFEFDNGVVDASHTTIKNQIKRRSSNLPAECFLGSALYDDAIGRATHPFVYDTNALMTPNVIRGCFELLNSREFIKIIFCVFY